MIYRLLNAPGAVGICHSFLIPRRGLSQLRRRWQLRSSQPNPARGAAVRGTRVSTDDLHKRVAQNTAKDQNDDNKLSETIVGKSNGMPFPRPSPPSSPLGEDRRSCSDESKRLLTQEQALQVDMRGPSNGGGQRIRGGGHWRCAQRRRVSLRQCYKLTRSTRTARRATST